MKGKVSGGVWQIIQRAQSNDVIGSSHEERANYFRELAKYLASLPKIKVEFAFDPSVDFTDKVSKFINKDSVEKIVLDVSVKPEILAGAKIEFKGIFKDYSYREKLDQVLVEKFKGTHEEF